MTKTQLITCLVSNSLTGIIGMILVIVASIFLKQTIYLRDLGTLIFSLSIFSIINGLLAILFTVQLIYVIKRKFEPLKLLLSGLLIIVTVLAAMCCIILVINQLDLKTQSHADTERLIRNYSDSDKLLNPKSMIGRIQQTFECCGVEKATDWKIINNGGTSTPDSCCRKQSIGCGKNSLMKQNKIYLRGCAEPIYIYLREKYHILILLNFFLIILSSISALFGCRLEFRDEIQCGHIPKSRIAGSEMPFIEQANLENFSDLVLIIDETYYFNVHQAFICTRTDYFSALTKNHFNETLPDTVKQDTRKTTMIIKHIRKELFLPLLFYIYCDECQISNDCVDDLLVLADELLLPGLKRLCGNTYSKLLSIDTIIGTLRLARLFQLVKLEDHCIRFIGEHLEEVLGLEDFAKFVLEDAASVIDRQETDSLPIIDDIRFYLAEFSTKTSSDINDTAEKMKLIDDFLEDIGLNS